jgi:monoamine oxidase
MSDVDVLVVGAGAAGLATAKALGKSGLTFRVLEAQDRIGGAGAGTVMEPFGIPFDWGCAWLHAADRNPFFDEAIERALTLKHHDLDLDHIYFEGRKATAVEMAQVFRADYRLAALLDANKAKTDTLASLIEITNFGSATATYHGPMDMAQDADEISAADAAGAADLDPNFLVKEGFGALVAAWGADVPVELSTPVRRLRWDGPGVVAETAKGDARARKTLMQPVGERVWFAGEALGGSLMQTCAGAQLSGEAAAVAAKAALQQ